MGAHTSKTYTSRTQRGLKALSSVSKKIKKAARKEKDLFKSLSASSQYKRENLKDRKLVKKWKIEEIMTNIAESIYKQYQGKIEWSKIVQSLKTDHPLNDKLPEKNKDVSISYKDIRYVRINTKDIEKYSRYLTDNR